MPESIISRAEDIFIFHLVSDVTTREKKVSQLECGVEEGDEEAATVLVTAKNCRAENPLFIQQTNAPTHTHARTHTPKHTHTHVRGRRNRKINREMYVCVSECECVHTCVGRESFLAKPKCHLNSTEENAFKIDAFLSHTH